MLKVRFLGQFSVTAGSDTVEILSRPAQSLFAYLILNAGVPQRRERLSGLFWPNSTVQNARSNLRHALWRIRKALNSGPTCSHDIIIADDFTICFDAAADYWLDTIILENQAGEESTAEALLQSVSVYCGSLLPGFYESWVLLERERLHAIFESKMGLLLLTRILTGETPHPGSGAVWEAGGVEYGATVHAGDGLVTIWDLGNNQITATVPTIGPGLFIRAHDQNPYVWADALFGEPANHIYAIDKETFTVTKIIKDGIQTLHPELTDDGKFVYISDWQGGVVRVYDAHTFALITELGSVTTPTGIFNTSRRYETLGH